MFDLNALWSAVALLSQAWEPWAVIVPGLLIGLIAGAIPAFSTSLAMVIFLPLIVYMDFLTAMLFLTSVFTGGGFATAIPSILINIPGSSSAVATAFDGYPMARKGLHNEALGLALMASVVGMLGSYLVLFVLIEQIAAAVLMLGPPEMLVIGIWGLTLIAMLRGHNTMRGLLAGALGILIGTVGMSAYGDSRGTLGIDALIDGFPVIPALIGAFAASELFNLANNRYIVSNESLRTVSYRKVVDGMRQAFRYPAVLFRGSLIGLIIGAVPGVGASLANLVSYGDAQRRQRDRSSMGKGNPVGVVAAEAANSSSEGGSMATLLALGIPGGAATAVLLGAFAMHDITGGPRFMMDNKDVVYAIVLANLVQGVLLIPLGLVFVRYAGGIVKVPLRILVPSVLAMSVIGAYAYTTNMWGPITLFGFGVLGWIMRRFDYPVAALVVGLLLGHMVEGEMLRSYQISGGYLDYFLGRPVFLVFLLLLVVSLCWPLLQSLRGRNGDGTLKLDQNT